MEVMHAEVDDFGLVSGPNMMGMAPAGHEEQVLRALHKAGSLDGTGIIPDIPAEEQKTE